MKFSVSTNAARSPPPSLGEHTHQVLADVMKLTEMELEELERDGVIKQST